ncbi:baseplate J/gp47 family protein [Ectothiorhodospira lacustris]|uniref:baseplate J/gp47 family protein n=1 Tax=Ectothiorhodospira lacustris TaxID=2899127 RepID=UPI001EE86196|nr:baseplate J/gp47 family protein [Ectothiorhodospira lacustris]MCG5501135.1 baseplate J/gp47 family protein [Ectothiorhodospira lacustris]MCG5511223.1 baseplate J/gp47 family protein [Ectothiorhodospira lacustris]MCG5522961.1 baseplate J/gp47 family protein [Ectothiorhodospira lacustris]
MTLPSPRLDDRSFDDLLAEAKRLVLARCPAWTDLSPGDPGTTLLELYAFLTQVMLYRINRIPEKAQVEFLRLMGVRLAPPGAARVTLLFSRTEGSTRPVTIPRGTRVTVTRTAPGEAPPVFATAQAVALPPEVDEIAVTAFHCEAVEGECLGLSSGLPGQSFRLHRPPVIAPTGDPLDLVVAVESEAPLDARVPALVHQGRQYRIWNEVEHFGRTRADSIAYVVDRTHGIVSFAPAVHLADGVQPAAGPPRAPQALAAIPAAGRQILAWYRRGGGLAGNVAAQTLVVLKDPIAGLRVCNPEAAVGGSEVETLDNAMLRGPRELHSLHRAVTARDFEAVALREGSVGRAQATAQADHWQYASPGTVQLLLVPALTGGTGGCHRRQDLEQAQTREALARVQQAVDQRRPLGTVCRVDWFGYKPVTVSARLILHAQESPEAVRRRVIGRLHKMINPLGTHALRRRLHVSDVYHSILGEPGVIYAERVRFLVEQAPDRDVAALAADPFHQGLWLAGAGGALFRSTDNGTGWEHLTEFPAEIIRCITCSPHVPGLTALITQAPAAGRNGSNVRLSRDCGRHWTDTHNLGFTIHDAAWYRRSGEAILLLATDEGLFQLPPGGGPMPVLVDATAQAMPLYAVTTVEAPRIGTQIAVAARATGGVYLCNDERIQSFRHIGLKGRDVRVLRIQTVGPRHYLWAGLAAVGGEEGDGCLYWELRRDPEDAEGWRAMARKWRGGSCRALAFDGEHVHAATFHAGIATLDSAAKDALWQLPRLDSGLPLRDTERLLHRLDALAIAPRHHRVDRPPTLLCGGPLGIFAGTRGEEGFIPASRLEYPDVVTAGEGFLFCSGDHVIEVRHDAAPGD